MGKEQVAYPKIPIQSTASNWWPLVPPSSKDKDGKSCWALLSWRQSNEGSG